uniref:Tripartite motif containing 47 n=1 Tax=Pundamilia nyererei TaxID=303518 RepID=A0A3B4FRQ4_9CICH
MSAASCLLSEDQFLCSICLNVFTDPVSTPCGHNFCKNCISRHWDISDRCQCPVCKKVFETRTELHINTFISEMVSQFRHETQQKVREVPCDICTGTKLKALKSCLVCLASYCQTHLEPHLTMKGLKRHQLIDPEENLEGRMCIKHDNPLELYCKTDQTCVCMVCCVFDHKTHEFVPLREEYEGKKAELVKTEAEIQQMIIKRLLKIRKIKKSVKMSKDAEGFIKALEQEISELMKRSSEVDIHPPSYEGTVVRAGVRAVSQLKETLNKEMKKLFEAELKRVQQYAVDVTLDPDTAHPKLILSDDGKQVHCGEEENDLPDNPERFSEFLIVLGKQSLSSGRFYFEVQVKYKTKLMLGVVTESVNRKEKFTVELNRTKGYWIVGVYKNNYIALEGLPVCLSLQSDPEKVGVFVDYEEGLVSFHDVDDAALIYSFTGCSFTGKLYPFFCPWNVDDDGKNSAPLIIFFKSLRCNYSPAHAAVY